MTTMDDCGISVLLQFAENYIRARPYHMYDSTYTVEFTCKTGSASTAHHAASEQTRAATMFEQVIS